MLKPTRTGINPAGQSGSNLFSANTLAPISYTVDCCLDYIVSSQTLKGDA
jgi:hypothetical protein